jgi:uncharacterized protein YbbC (DUF1343 family)/CubicO group peptidase (beta-lactamase class C family)
MLRVAFLLCFALPLAAETYPVPEKEIDAAVQAAIERKEIPGAVVMVISKDRVLLHKAYGHSALKPEKKAMTVDTVFDLASITKPVATASSIILLHERSKLKLSDPVAKHWPEFAANGKGDVTIEQCLVHTTGLTADNSINDYAEGKAIALQNIAALKLEAPPGTRFRYSDVGFMVLGHLIEKITGEDVHQFSKKNLFDPLGMSDTGYLPQGKIRERCAPTGQRNGQWMIGEVHDPRAFRMDGVAGHAGLFGSSTDLAKFARMLLHEGELDGKRILSPLTVRLYTSALEVPGGLRSRGWDVDTSFSAPRGKNFTRGISFGHTGFTGTSIWIDPPTQTIVIILTNRVHPEEKGNATPIRREIANLVSQAPPLQQPEPKEVLTGIDVLQKEKFVRLKGKKVGLVTNHTGRDRFGRATIDLLHAAEGVQLVALFSPEHGIRGQLDEKVGDSKDEKTGLPIYSLYGKRTKPTKETLEGIDTLVYDIQDIGCRFYTYISTMGNILEVANEFKLKVVILDRPNPIGGLIVEGPLTDPKRESFIAYHSLPIRHGMTVGELAQLFKAEKKLTVELEIVKVEGWKRGDLFDQTGLSWVNPSPNMRNLTEALLYPGIGLLETTNLSVGRGTERPFEWIGAPWLDGSKLAHALTRRNLPGVRFVPCNLTPNSSTHKEKPCGGVQIFVDDWKQFRPVSTGLQIAHELRLLYPDDWNVKGYDRLLVHQQSWQALNDLTPISEIEKSWVNDLKAFQERRAKYLIYAE